MAQITHMNFGWLHSPPLPPASCHCLMIRSDSGIALVDCGIGVHDIADPDARIGREVVDAAGFQFLPAVTAIHQLAMLNIRPMDVTDIVMTHCDPDHAGGLSDFPNAKVHISAEEKQNLESANPGTVFHNSRTNQIGSPIIPMIVKPWVYLLVKSIRRWRLKFDWFRFLAIPTGIVVSRFSKAIIGHFTLVTPTTCAMN